MVLEDVTEFDYTGSQTKLPKILLNGNNICMVSPRKMSNGSLLIVQLIPGGDGPGAVGS